MSFVVIESPYGTNPDGTRADAATMAENVRYLHACILDCLRRGEVPYASHGFFPGPLNDAVPEERKAGIEAGFKIGRVLAAAGAVRAFYVDRGETPGMLLAVPEAERIGQRTERRTLPGWQP
jgi:hypothetical protein